MHGEKSRMAQPPRPRRQPPDSPPLRQRKLKDSISNGTISNGTREPNDRLLDSPLAAAPAPTVIRQSPSPPEASASAPRPAAETQPATATYPDNIDVEALTKNLVRLVEEGGRAA